MSDLSVPKVKATWTPAFHEIFVEVCLEQTLKGNKPGTYFNKEGWKNILESFGKKTGVRYDRKQLKNHWDCVCKQWKAWCRLINCSSMKWDPETNTFGATQEDWANHLKVNPEAAQFQLKELPHVEKLEVIFAGKMNNGDKPLLVQRKRKAADSTTSLCDANAVDLRHEQRFASGPSESSSLLTKIKATWTPAFHEIFIDLCLEEVLKGNKPGTHFTRDGWMNIVDSFYVKTGTNYDRIQLENHLDHTKEQWKIWCKLINDDRMKWDPDTRCFGASEEDWMNYTQEHPEAAHFRHKELQCIDKLEIIFDEATSTGETDPLIRQMRSKDNSTSSYLLINEHTMANPISKSEYLFDAVESRSPVTVPRSPAPIQSMPNKFTYNIGECIECLDGMEEVEQGSDLYLFALDIFLKKEYREIFLQLKKPSVRIAWLQRLQSVGPPLI